MNMKMSRFITFTLISIFFIAISNSCKKDKTSDNTTPSTKSPEELLSANAWKIEKIRTLQNGSFYYYQRGTSNHDLDNESINFKTDHTGTYTGPDGTEYAISSWNFIDDQKTQIQYLIEFSAPLQVNWDNVALTSTSLRYGEYHNLGGVNTLSVAKRIPK